MIHLLLPAIVFLFHTSIYTQSVTGISDSAINFSSFEGKKILIVNIATNSPKVGQLTGLQQLHTQYGDSLVIIGFPSNSFGNEPRTNSEILEYCQTQYNVSFLLAAKAPVKDSSIQSFYYWLTNKSENGTFNNAVTGDFQKYLFDSHGNAIGIFSGQLSPLSPQIVNAITGTQN